MHRFVLALVCAAMVFLGISFAVASDGWFECRVRFVTQDHERRAHEVWMPPRKSGSLGQAITNARAAYKVGDKYDHAPIVEIVGEPYCLSADPPNMASTAMTQMYECRLAMRYRVFRRVAHEKGQWVYDTKAPVGNPERYKTGLGPDKGAAKTSAFSAWQSSIKSQFASSPAYAGDNVFVMVEFTDLIGDCWLKGSPKPSEPSGWPRGLAW